MLLPRILTAVVLLAILSVCLSSSSEWPLLALLNVMAALTLWEWLRMVCNNGKHKLLNIIIALLTSLVLFILATQILSSSGSQLGISFINVIQASIPVIAIMWIIVPSLSICRVTKNELAPKSIQKIFAIAAVIALWYSLAIMFVSFGAFFLISLMALIWIADTAAYIVGRLLGKHKLAPAVSPGKTIEGALGGIAGAMLWMALSSSMPNSFAYYLDMRWGFIAMLLISALLACISITGDLFESILKRRAGLKDSSNLLPGHGGIFDRIDALLPVAPLAFVIIGAA